MPNRILRDWTDSEPVNSLSWQAECLFIRLIMKADDYGCFHANPRLLKSLLFPLKDGLRDADITRWITECVKSGLLRVYTKDGKPFIEIVKFGQRMKQSRRKFPEPPEEKTGLLPGTSGNFRELPGTSGNFRELPGTSGNFPLETDTETDIETEASVPRAPAWDDPFPKTPEEVIELAENPVIGMKCTKEQAEAYLGNRIVRDWIPYGSTVRMKTRQQVCFDLKKWLTKDLNDERERKLKNGDNRHNFANDPDAYDPADDGSNI